MNNFDQPDGTETTTNKIAEETVTRRLNTFDLTCLGWNSVIGSGLFIAQKSIAEAVGPYGPILFLVGGFASLPVALCFGRMAQLYPGTGGASLYADRAFGRWPGFLVGWVMWSSGLIGGATVAVAFSSYLCGWFHWNAVPGVAAALILGLAAVNALGSRGGAWSNNVLALGKLWPLVLALVVGMVSVAPREVLLPVMELPSKLAWRAGLLAVLYTFSGFEEIALPAGEVKNAERAVTRATLGVVLSSAVLYSVLQGVVSALGAASAERPLEAAFAGSYPWLSTMLAAAAFISLASVNASIAFTTPRSLWTLAHLGWFPKGLTSLHRGAPLLCIAISALLTVVLALSNTQEMLISLSVLAALLQHLATSLAACKETPAGVPQLAVLVCFLLLGTSEPSLLLGMAESMAVGVLVVVLWRRWWRR